jgi:glycosyltransferase involved in cell wall biosynthesis
MISIIIPALNEENNIKRLLESIKKQDFFDYEIIVADAGSEDKTKEIALAYNCIVIKGGLPAKGRNEGSKIAKGEILFFLDADTILQDNFLKNSINEFVNRKLEIASFRLIPISGENKSKIFLDIFYNIPIIIFEKLLPHAATGIIVTKNVFEKVGGFDEDIKLSEDHYMARRAQKIAKFGLIRSAKLLISDRRFKKDGWLKVGIKYLFCELHMIFIGPVKSDIFKYKFDHYDKDKS